ncbi:neuronal acetylcholine receptor subunit alpha-3-like [Ylistrum balloti]|uniref:neuronal acetylcholine receptor subunit alpha-3-like n=1 Tax=Ylistrum balloti TaxID=509963 RepID=UPI0029059CDC|nr:neuronal acetylcholine receptor subunit alpha-3-like [Ylistrum balloti]
MELHLVNVKCLALVLGLALCYVHLSVAKPPLPYSKDVETTLRTYLLTNYSVDQRPQERVSITVSLTLITINDMNIKAQVLSISGYFNLVWFDSRLEWINLSDYSNIRYLFSSQTVLWRPALVVDNSVDNLNVISKPDVPMRILSTGRVVWNPADIYRVACESDTTYYPMDTQSCVISLSSWSYTSSEVNLVLDVTDDVNLDYYSENGEWEMISAYGARQGTEEMVKGGKSFSTAKFYINLRRRPLFHILNTLFPVALLAIMSAMVFKLSVDSGEKIGFSLTVLLAYAVYLTLISESIPSTSITICYLSIYLSLVLTLGTLSVLCTIAVVTLYNHPDEDEPVTGCLYMITVCLMKLTCWNGCKCKCCKRETKVRPTSDQANSIQVDDSFDIGVPISEKAAYPLDLELNECEREKNINWKVVARVLDNFFFLLFMSLILASSLGYFMLIALKYWENTSS